jgi:hypothetical protein
MATIDLKIIADSTQAVQEINKVTETTKTMQRTVQEGDKRQKGLIEDLTDAIKKMEIARSKAMTIEGIEKQNKKLAEARQTLKEYENTGVQANQKIEKSGNSLLKGIGKWALGFATVATAVKLFKSIIASTETATHKFEVVVESAKSGIGFFFKAIASGDWSNFSAGLENAIKGAKRFVDELESITNLTNEQLIKSAEYDKEISDLRADTWNRDEENIDKRKQALTEIIDLQKKKFDEEAELLRRAYENNLKKAASDAGLSEAMIENFIKEYSSLEDLVKIGEKYNEITKAMRQPGMTGENIAQFDAERKALGENAKEASKYAKQVGKVTEETRAGLAKGLTEAIQKEAQFNATNRRDKMQLAAIEEEERKKKEDAEKDAYEKRLKLQEEFQKAAEKLLDDYDKAKLDEFTGKERIVAERNLNLALIDEQRKFMEERGKLTAEQTEQFKALYNNIWNEAELALVDFDIAEIEERQKTADKVAKTAKDNAANLLDIQRETQEFALELLGDNEEAKQDLQIKFLEEDRAAISKKILNNEGTEAELQELTALYTLYGIKINTLLKKQADEAKGFSISKALGLTEKEGEKLTEGLQFIVENISSALSDITSARVEEATKNVSLIEDQIAQTRAALDQELELAKQGFANNVSAKQQELAELEKARKKALEDQKKALKAQQQVDTVIQTISLITSAAQVFKDFSKIPVVGVPLAIAMIATMFAAFAAAKVKAVAAAKLAEGGVGTETGIISGKRHSEGGEPFLNHVEVERGEMWGVLSKSAAAKHGKEFSQIVTSFNKDNLVVERMDAPNNYINVDVNQTNSRLDKVENQLIKLNRHFAGQKEVHETADMRIEKIGNKTRIIRK